MRELGTFTIEASHPALEGHFPGRPIVPGVVLLDHVMALAGGVAGFGAVKFTRPVRPGDTVVVRVDDETVGGERFEAAVGGQTVLSGTLRRAATSSLGG